MVLISGGIFSGANNAGTHPVHNIVTSAEDTGNPRARAERGNGQRDTASAFAAKRFQECGVGGPRKTEKKRKKIVMIKNREYGSAYITWVGGGGRECCIARENINNIGWRVKLL